MLAVNAVAIGGPDAILEPDCALATWRRGVPANLAPAIAAIDLAPAEPVSVSAKLDTLAAVLADALGAYPAVLQEDILALAGPLAHITRTGAVTVRLETVAMNACHRFHADYLTVRLLTTYVGQATLCVHADTPEDIRQLAAGDVARFRGRVLADPPPVLHRSPLIEGTGERRLMLVIDPVHPE
jgi:hypothetical protein